MSCGACAGDEGKLALKPNRAEVADANGAYPLEGLGSCMRTNLIDGDRVLLDRYIESVLLRFSDNKVNLGSATAELAEMFVRVAQGEENVLDHMRGVVEAGDDA